MHAPSPLPATPSAAAGGKRRAQSPQGGGSPRGAAQKAKLDPLAWASAEAVPLELALQASGARRPRPGDAADLVVLAEPPYALSAADLAAIPVHATFVGGRCVHGPWAQD